MSRIIDLPRAHDHIVPVARKRSGGFGRAPAEKKALGLVDDVAMSRFLPAAGDASARGEKGLDARRKLRLQHRSTRSVDLVGTVRIGDDVQPRGVSRRHGVATDIAQPRQRFRRAGPCAKRHFVSTDVDDLRRKQLGRPDLFDGLLGHPSAFRCLSSALSQTV